MQYQVRWRNGPVVWSWEASVDGGKTWVKLKADNENDSSEAIEEASERFCVSTNKWELIDE